MNDAFDPLRIKFRKAALKGLLSCPKSRELLSLESLCPAAAQIAEDMVQFAKERIGGPYSDLHDYAADVLSGILAQGYESLDMRGALPKRVYDLADTMMRTRIPVKRTDPAALLAAAE